jgi:O-antigen/teichoic acid export membrane protein
MTLALGPALSRHVTFHFGSNERAAVDTYMSSGLAAMTIVAAVLVLTGLILAVALPHLVDLGASARPAQILMALLGVMTALSVLTAAFRAPAVAREWLAELSWILTAGELVRVGLIVAAFEFAGPALPALGGAAVAGALTTGIITVFVARRALPWVRVSFRKVTRVALRHLFTFSLLLTVIPIVTIVYTSVGNFVIKWVYGDHGATMITVYTTGAAWELWIRGMMMQVIRVMNPRMTLLHAEGRSEQMRRGCLIATRYATAIVAPVAFLLVVMGRPLLSVWLGDKLDPVEIAMAATVLAIILPASTIDLGTDPIDAAFAAMDRLRVPAAFYVGTAIIYVALSIGLAKYAGWGLYGVAASTAAVLLLRSLVFRPLYVNAVLGLSARDLLLRGSLPPLLLAASCAGLCFATQRLVEAESLLAITAMVATFGLLYAMAAWWLVLLGDDRVRLTRIVKRWIQSDGAKGSM